MYLYKIARFTRSDFYCVVADCGLKGIKLAMAAYEQHFNSSIEKEKDKGWHPTLKRNRDSALDIKFVRKIDLVHLPGVDPEEVIRKVKEKEGKDGTDATHGDD